jgi:Holliday junction resolvase
MNSRTKGKVGEREFAHVLSDNGFPARRGQQFCGGPASPDVICAALPWLHVEVKRVEALNLTDACAQAEGDCGGKPWIVAHRRNHAPWLITMHAETFFQFLRGALPPESTTNQQTKNNKASDETQR